MPLRATLRTVQTCRTVRAEGTDSVTHGCPVSFSLLSAPTGSWEWGTGPGPYGAECEAQEGVGVAQVGGGAGRGAP